MHSRLMNYVMTALLALAVVELVYAWRAKKAVHSFRDTVSSISLGIGQQAINVYLAGFAFAAYAIVHQKYSVARADPRVWWHWVVLVFAADFAYYCGHRTAHNVNLFVGGHIAHHHAEDFNLLSALRQSWTAWILMFPFFLPLAVIGFPPEMFVYGQLGIMFFQFTSHFGLFRLRLGVLDRLFITPQNHRIHHGATAPYWGANCGGMFVLWDRILGTYQQERSDVPLRTGSGLTLNFYNPFEANVEYFRRIWFVAKRRHGIGKVAIWFQSPDVLATELDRLGYEEAARRDVVRTPPTLRERIAIVGALVLSIALFGAHRALFDKHPPVVNALTGAAVFSALWGLGFLLSRRTNAATGMSARGTRSGSRTSPTPRSHTADAEPGTREAPNSPLATAGPCDLPRDERRTPYTALPESPSLGSRRSDQQSVDGHEP